MSTGPSLLNTCTNQRNAKRHKVRGQREEKEEIERREEVS
jgi:hypothetical protein